MKVYLILFALATFVLACYAHPAPQAREPIDINQEWVSQDGRSKLKVFGTLVPVQGRGGLPDGYRGTGHGFQVSHTWGG